MGQVLKAEAAREERDDACILEMLDDSDVLQDDSRDPDVNRRSRRMLGLVEARILQRRFRRCKVVDNVRQCEV